MFLVMKRFPMDDMPLCLVSTNDEALVRVGEDQTKSRFATGTQQDIADCDISCEAISYMIVKFNSKGLPVNSEIHSYAEEN